MREKSEFWRVEKCIYELTKGNTLYFKVNLVLTLVLFFLMALN